MESATRPSDPGTTAAFERLLTGIAEAAVWRLVERDPAALAPGGGFVIRLTHVVPPRPDTAAAVIDIDPPHRTGRITLENGPVLAEFEYEPLGELP